MSNLDSRRILELAAKKKQVEEEMKARNQQEEERRRAVEIELDELHRAVTEALDQERRETRDNEIKMMKLSTSRQMRGQERETMLKKASTFGEMRCPQQERVRARPVKHLRKRKEMPVVTSVPRAAEGPAESPSEVADLFHAVQVAEKAFETCQEMNTNVLMQTRALMMIKEVMLRDGFKSGPMERGRRLDRF